MTSVRIEAEPDCPPGVYTIPTRITSRVTAGSSPSPPHDNRRSGLLSRSASTNLTHIKALDRPSNNNSQLPIFLNANVRSLAPKTDELALLINQHHVSVAAISESWLHDGIDSSVVNVPGYTLFRRDRLHGRGGGVCAFVSDAIPCKRQFDLENASFECMWLWLRPHRLPRSITGIVSGVVYSPPGTTAQDQRNLTCYLIETLDTTRNKFPDCGISLLGDFNNLDLSELLSSHNLSQVVNEPTRNSANLDLIITNMQSYYNKPIILAPIGTSDHNAVVWLTCNSARTARPSIRDFKIRHYG